MRKITLKFLILSFIALCLFSCADETDYRNDGVNVTPSNPIRAVIANEGQFAYGTASLTVLNVDGSVKNDVFRIANDRPLGDVAQSITHIGDYFYVTLNNSRKIEIMNDLTFKSIETISTPDASIPTYMCHLGADSMAVSEKGSSGRLLIVDLNHSLPRNPIRRVIEGVGSANQMLLVNNKLFLAGSTLRVFTLGQINSNQMRTIKDKNGENISISGDSKIVLDKNNNIWVLNSSRLICINPDTETPVKELPFSGVTVGSFDGRLDISPNGNTLFFTGRVNSIKGILSLDINDITAPTQLTFPLNDVKVIYNMAVSKQGTIFICDVQYGSIARGWVHEFTPSGEKLKSFEAGIFPQYIYFLN